MEKTVGSNDQIIRVVLGIAIGYFAYSTNFEAQWLQIVLFVIAVILFATAFTRFCLLYSIFKINTCNIKE